MSLLTVNLGGFNTTFAQYIQTTRYSIQKGMAYQLRNWLYQATRVKNWSDEPRVPVKLEPKHVAWLMSSGKYGEPRSGKRKPYRVMRKKDGSRRWMAATQKMIASGKTGMRMRWYSRAEAQRFARRHVVLRQKSSHWISAFFYRMDRMMKTQVGGQQVKEGNARAARAIQAVYNEQAGGNGKPSVVAMRSHYDYARATTRAKQPNVPSAKGVERHIVTALEAAKASIIPNMEAKIRDIYDKAARGIRR